MHDNVVRFASTYTAQHLHVIAYMDDAWILSECLLFLNTHIYIYRYVPYYCISLEQQQ